MRLLTLFALAAAAVATISDCDPASRFRPTELAVTPDPPVAGQPVAMTVKFDNPGTEVTDGTVTTSVTLNFIPFQPTEEPLCQNTACPIQTGPVDRSTSSTWPTGVNGLIVAKSEWTSADGESLLCVQTKFAVGAAARLRGAANETIATAVADALWHDDWSAKQVALWEVPVVDNATCPAVTNFVWWK